MEELRQDIEDTGPQAGPEPDLVLVGIAAVEIEIPVVASDIAVRLVAEAPAVGGLVVEGLAVEEPVVEELAAAKPVAAHLAELAVGLDSHSLLFSPSLWATLQA